MATREKLLEHLWRVVINGNLDSAVLSDAMRQHLDHPEKPFADTGAAVQRLFALGASPTDLCLLRRDAAYGAVFATLYALGDPGVDGNDVLMLHESLLGADPSGFEGRPGSAAAV